MSDMDEDFIYDQDDDYGLVRLSAWLGFAFLHFFWLMPSIEWARATRLKVDWSLNSPHEGSHACCRNLQVSLRRVRQM